MKLLIIAFTFFAALCNAEELQTPEESVLLDPGFLMGTSWAHQTLYHELQDEIDQAFVEINGIVAKALVKYSESALKKYSDHAQETLAVYDPIFDKVLRLPTSDCRTLVTSLLQNSVSISGFSSSNCSTTSARLVQAEAKVASDTLTGFTGKYGQVVLNVYQSYVGRNAMVESEIIESNINNTFAAIAANWENSAPEITQIETTLNNNINSYSVRLNGCFSETLARTVAMIELVDFQVGMCGTWDSGSRANRNLRNKDTSRDIEAEFAALVGSFKPYEF